jgi:hypothetical protein
VPARPGDQHVFDIFPQRTVLLEVITAAVLRPFASVMN